jgi:hypothetical protein
MRRIFLTTTAASAIEAAAATREKPLQHYDDVLLRQWPEKNKNRNRHGGCGEPESKFGNSSQMHRKKVQVVKDPQ